MAATYQIDVFHGAGPSAGAYPAGGRHHRADTDPTTDGATTFIPVPTSGTAYGWRKSLKLNVTVAPVGIVSNLRFFGDGTLWGIGVACYVKLKASYTQATSADNTALFDGTAVELSNYTSSSPLTVNAGTVLTATTGYGTQDYVVLQVAGDASVAAGVTSARTVSYRIDET